MIERISIGGVATYSSDEPVVLDNLKKINYIFGANGTGKTTLGRVIAGSISNDKCCCTWRAGQPLETLVLNRDFVEKNFMQLPGVFTLGEKQKDTEERIAAAKDAKTKEEEKLANLKQNLGSEDREDGKRGELAKLEKDFGETCWKQKQKHDEKLQGAFTGYRNNVDRFKQKILDELNSNTAALKLLSDLERRAAIIFGKTPTKEEPIPVLNTTALLAHESNPILKKKVIGKDDVDIAAMIKKLGNSDWVRQGLKYYKDNNQVCPFCQQNTTEAFAQSLGQYFDERFEEDIRAIDELIMQYANDASNIQAQINSIIDAPGRFIDVDELKTHKVSLDQAIISNKHHLEKKRKEPSEVVELQPLAPFLMPIRKLIDDANIEVDKHNQTVDNFEGEKKKLTDEVWKFVIEELRDDIEAYQKKKEDIQKAIDGISENIEKTEKRIEEKKQEIRDLEKQVTSIQPTIDAINKILRRFNFNSFELKMAPDGKHYKLVRPNGDDARETLSEGEKTFVVFLYFYHLLEGSTAESGVTADRVVVFDDPVSSLDSNVLFIVSTLIRKVCEDCCKGIGHIKQVFVMTHNVYFHREVTYNKQLPRNQNLSNESFWIVRRSGQHSQIKQYPSNPIKTTYELLWREMYEAQDAMNNGGNVSPCIENTLRRILEHYFTILGSIKFDELCEKFDNKHEKLVCRSLFSWMHAGSHHAFDDVHITSTPDMVAHLLEVFKNVFIRTGHEEHYKMMMESIEEDVAQTTAWG